MAKHPGFFLKEMLKEKKWLQADLIYILGSSEQSVNLIINEKTGISPEMSKALGKAFGLSEDYFLQLQKEYELARAKELNTDIEIKARAQNKYPIREMIKRGWIKKDEPLEKELQRFFNVDDIEQIPLFGHAAKKTDYSNEISSVQLAWLYRVKEIAQKIVVQKYSHNKLKDALMKLKSCLKYPEEISSIPSILYDCGVKFIIVESLPSGKIDGVCFWENNTPVIALSIRYDRIDNFWFVLRHEIQHVLNEDGKNDGMTMIDDFDNRDHIINEQERIANEVASEFCIPQNKLQSFINRKKPFFYEKDVLAFAGVNDIHPGIVVGQLQYKTGKYDLLKKYQIKIRKFATENAYVDGWDQYFNYS